MPRKKKAAEPQFDPYAGIGDETPPEASAKGDADDTDKRIEALGAQIAGLTKGLETMQATQMPF